MMYIHQTSCISAQQTFVTVNIDQLQAVLNNKLQAREPSYEGIPTGVLRRMGKAVRLGVGTALPLLKLPLLKTDGIIIGTADGGMEDCIKFLNQIIQYEEGMLTPTNFVQSTTNAIAAQIALLSNNHAYNSTHVHRGLAFENALLDAGMLLLENKHARYLVGGVDEISAYNYNIDNLQGWYKEEPVPANDLYAQATPGSLAGEGAAMFLVGADKDNAIAQVTGIHTLHTQDERVVADQLQWFLNKYAPGKMPGLLLSGENGDARLAKYYEACETVLNGTATVARFKHMTGEYATVSAIALWLACYILQESILPEHMIKYKALAATHNSMLICNNYKGMQHSFMLVEPVV